MPSSDERWQRRMAPFMVSAVVLTAIFFAIVMLAKFAAIEQTLQELPQAQITIPWTKDGLAPTSWRDQAELASDQARFLLERELVARRYRQAAASLSLRLWTRFMGFLTGMILAMVGAAFVLGKLVSPESEISGGAQGATVSIKSASPGVVMAALGSVLIGIAIATPVTSDVRDGAIYFGRSDTPDDMTSEPDPAINAANPANDSESPPRKLAGKKAVE